MGKLILINCITLILIGSCRESEAALITAANAFTAAKAIVDVLPVVKRLLRDGNTTDEERILEAQAQTFNKLDHLGDSVSEMKNRILHKLTYTLSTKLSEKIDQLFELIEHVQMNYNLFQAIIKHNHYTKSEMIAFAKINTGFHIQDLPAVIKKMHAAFIDKDFFGDSILTMLARYLDDYSLGCIRKQSAQQLIYELYKIVVDTDIRGYVMKRFSYSILYELDNDYTSLISHYNTKMTIEDNNHYATLNATYTEVRRNMVIASRTVWQCDEIELRRGVTYEKFENIFQGFLIYEADTPINKVGHDLGVWRTVYNAIVTTCDEIQNSRYRCHSQVCKAQPEERRCQGNLRDCTFLAEDVQACHSPPGSERRYDWMRKLESQDYYGQYYDNCLNTQGLIAHKGFSVCLCNCESEKRDSDRYFSLFEVTSDTIDNKVVLGVRFVKKGRVFYIQIQQGELTNNGTIKGVIEWKKIREITDKELMSQKVSTTFDETYLLPNRATASDRITQFRTNNIVYTLTYNQRTVYLDDLEVQPGHVLTGLRFQQVNNALRLEIQSTPFDILSGKLNVNYSTWLFNDRITTDRSESRSSLDDDPTKSTAPYMTSFTNEYVQFKPSDLRKDAWQTTIPFIEILPVVPKAVSPIPLSGVGLFYKYDNSHAGFLSFKVSHYDLAQLM